MGDPLQNLYFALVLLSCLFLVRSKTSLLHLKPSKYPLPDLKFTQLLMPFSLYFVLSIFLYALFSTLIIMLHKEPIDPSEQNPLALYHPYVDFLIMSLSLSSLLLYCSFHPNAYLKQFVWRGKNFQAWRYIFYNLLQGVKTYFFAFPFIFMISHLVNVLLTFFIGEITQEQDAVLFFKNSLSNPASFFCTIILIACIIPCIEELFFRGFLYSYFRKHLGTFWAIQLTSFIFALFHFSTNQGWKNIELILSLYTLSLFITWAYEKRRTLFAPLGLHMTINLVSIIVLSFQEKPF